MVAVTKSLPVDTIKKQLKSGEKVAIISCNTCTRSMSPPTGGAEAAQKLKENLEKDGFTVTDTLFLTAACFEDYIEEFKSILSDKWTTGIILACESGYGVVKAHLPNRRLIRGLETLGVLMKYEKAQWKPVVKLDI